MRVIKRGRLTRGVLLEQPGVEQPEVVLGSPDQLQEQVVGGRPHSWGFALEQVALLMLQLLLILLLMLWLLLILLLLLLLLRRLGQARRPRRKQAAQNAQGKFLTVQRERLQHLFNPVRH